MIYLLSVKLPHYHNQIKNMKSMANNVRSQELTNFHAKKTILAQKVNRQILRKYTK